MLVVLAPPITARSVPLEAFIITHVSRPAHNLTIPSTRYVNLVQQVAEFAHP